MPEGEYLALISAKHNVDPVKFFEALVSAEEETVIRCGCLSIECRGCGKLGRIFLIMDGSRVVAQVKISEGFLSAKTNPIVKFMESERVRRYVAKKDASSFKLSGIGDLHVGMAGVNVSAKVMEVGEPNTIQTRSGNQFVVANAVIADKTGTVKLTLWGDQVGAVSVGDTVQIANAHMLAFKGEKQLRIGRKGTLKIEREHASPT